MVLLGSNDVKKRSEDCGREQRIPVLLTNHARQQYWDDLA